MRTVRLTLRLCRLWSTISQEEKYVGEEKEEEKKNKYHAVPRFCSWMDTNTPPPFTLIKLSPGAREEVVVWEIFRAEDRPRVETFLQTSNANSSSSRGRTGEMDPTDPFTFGSTYLNDQQLHQLYEQTTPERNGQREEGENEEGEEKEEKEGVRPYRVEQAYGEVVMIPAGCLRQARFVYEATLVKVDFISPERASWTLETTALMRRCSLARQAAAAQKSTRRSLKCFDSVPDTLQTRSLLLYSALAAAEE